MTVYIFDINPSACTLTERGYTEALSALAYAWATEEHKNFEHALDAIQECCKGYWG